MSQPPPEPTPSGSDVAHSAAPAAALDHHRLAPRPRVWPVYVAFPMVLLGGMLVSVVLLILLVLIADTRGTIEERTERLITAPWVLCVLMLPVMAMQIGAAVVPAALSCTPFRRRLNLLAPRLPWAVLLAATVGALAYSCATTGLFAVFNINTPALEQLGKVIEGVTGPMAVVVLALVGFVGPLAEELFFRGYLQTRLVARHGPAAGIIIASAFFGFMHLDLAQSPFAFIFGLYLGTMAYRAQSIYPAIVAHMVNNTGEVLLSWSRFVPTPQLWIAIIVGGTALAVALLVPCLLMRRRPSAPDAG